MSSDHCSQVDLLERIHKFVVVGASNELTEEHWTDFELLLRENDDACRLYGQYIDVSVLLPAILSSIPNEESPTPDILFPEQQEPVCGSAPGLLSTVWHGTTGFFSQEVPFAISIATVVTGFGLLIGSLIHMPHPEQIQQIAENSSPMPTVVEPRVEIVGRITGMVDCKWADPATMPVGDNVVLGHRYALASGLMEITYDTGAKVILQGPVTYEVESHNGGFLSVGKLTARVEKRGPDSNPQSLIPNPSPLSPLPSPLFTIKTPTATVTDLGTEFGVEVSQSGACEIHVIEGRVKTVRTSATTAPGEEVILSANQAIRLDPARPKYVVITADPGRFKVTRAKTVRRSPLRWPLLDKTFVVWVSLANVDQQGVGVVSLVDMPEWDGIVFGELDRAKWMAGSHGYTRTQKEQSEYPIETAVLSQFVQIALVYGAPNITIYRNGQKYAEYPVLDQITFNERSIVMIGKRHPWYLAGQESKSGPSSLPTLVGAVEEARFYDVSLTQEQIAALKPNEPSPIGPVGQWTFEDGTARDSTGNFPMGELHGNARIVDGKLILDGADSYLLVPAALKPNKQPPTDAKARGESDTLGRELYSRPSLKIGGGSTTATPTSQGESSREPKEESRIENQ